MTSELILPKAQHDLADYVRDNVGRILPMLHPAIDQQSFAAAVVVAANELEPNSCTPESVLIAAYHAARVGLLPGKMQNLCYFIPRKKKRTDRFATCNLEIGYQGYTTLAFDSGHLKNLYAEVILEGEIFSQRVVACQLVIEHDIPLSRDLNPKTLRQRVTGAYCVYETTMGGRSGRVMNRQQLNRVDTQMNVWLSDYYPMCRKSPIKLAANDWVKTPRLSWALRLDDQAEMGAVQDIGGGLDIAKPAAEFSLSQIEEGENDASHTGNEGSAR